MVNLAESAATAISQAMARLIPAPAATPLTAAITGFDIRFIREIAPWKDVSNRLRY